MATITQIIASQILDSRGIPTVEATVYTDSGQSFSSSAPAGTSTAKKEAIELRDNDPKIFFGMGVTKAVSNINTIIAPKLKGSDPTNQTQIDKTLVDLDGTENKSKLGANATLAVSQAVCKAGAASHKLELFDYIGKKYSLRTDPHHIPTATFNMINGGKHGAGNLDFQEFLIIPPSTTTFPGAIRLASEIYHALEATLIRMNAIHSVGIEGGFAPNLFTNKDALEILIEAVRSTDYSIGKDVFMGLDVAASHFYQEGKYKIKDRPKPVTSEELIEFYQQLNASINLFELEDPFDEEDWKAWTQITSLIGENTLIVGDDLLATNKTLLKRAIDEKACTAILVKPNQIGTISETVEVTKIAKQANIQTIVAHRSGDTSDTFIADFAVGVGAGYTKFGAPSRGERTAKYNRLLKIDSLINPQTQAPQQASPSPATPQPTPATQPKQPAPPNPPATA